MANTDIVTREDIGNGLAINANKLEADFTKVASKNDLLTKADLVNGKVPASQLPSFIDEIQEYPSIATFPITGQSDILYLALDTNKLYRWSGTAYVDLSALAGMPDFALNANVVHKTLDETIDGIKSFNSPIYAQDGVSLKNNNAPLLQTGRTILYANASQFGFLNGNDKGAIFMYNNANSLVYELPSETGTLALLSDLAPYLTIVGAESTYQTLANLSGDLTASATKYPSVNAVNAGLATKFNNPTGTVSQYLRGDGSIANFPFIPTLIWGNIGGNLSDQTDLQSALDGKFNNPTGTTSDYIRGDGSISAFPAPYGLLPTGGEAGQILSKIDGTDYNATWIDNYALWTSVLRHEVKAGEALNKGQAVYISPIQDGTNMIVTKADYSQESTSSKTLGLVMQSLTTNDFGQVVTEGLLGGLNTIGANQGDPVWLGASGNLIYGLANKPEAPNHLVFIGIVTRVNANNGEIFVKVQNGFELNEIHDVKILNKANNEVLAYEQSSGLWKNKAINDLIGYVPANDKDVLHLGGNETVSGNKTFTGATAIAGLFIDETFGYANIDAHTQLKAHADYFHFNASSNNKGAKFIYGTIGQRIYSLPTADGVLALTSDIPTLSGLGGVPLTRTISINGTTYDLSENRTWNLSATEVATALGYTPLATESDPIFTASPAGSITALQIGNWNTAYGWGNHASAGYLTAITSAQVTGALGYTPVPTTRTITINGTAYDLSADRAWTIASGVTSFNTRTGAITLISADVTGALRFTPYNASNPSGYISGITSGMVTTALGYTPYNSSNPAGYISGISSGMVTTALGYTPYNSSNPAGYITASSLSSYLPLSGGNLSGNLRLVSISGNDQMVENTYGAYLHLGGWGVGRTDATAILVNTAYRADYADALFDMNISRFTNNSGYITSSALSGYLPLGGGTMSGNLALADNKLYLRTNGDENHYLWNASDDWEEMRFYGGTGFRIQSSNGGSMATFTNSGFTSNGLIRVNANDDLYLDYNYGCSIVGVYTSTVYQGVFSMGNAYKLARNGSTPGNLYGMAWSHPYAGGQAGYLNDHGLLVMVNGITYSAISSNIWARGNVTANGYVYANASMRMGDMWEGGGLYRSSGNLVFGTEGAGYKFMVSGTQRAYIGTDGNMWMQWAGSYISDLLAARATHRGEGSNYVDYSRYVYNNGAYSGSGWIEPSDLGVRYAASAGYASSAGSAGSAGNSDTVDGYHMNQAVTVNASPTFQEVYANGWFRSTGYQGHYNPTNGAHWYPNDNSYGTWKIQGSRNGWGGHVTNHNYILSLMLNTSGDYGFLTENGNWWNLFYNNGNNCWGIGTDNTYSGDGFRCIKYGSSQYGWTTWSDRRAKENISTIKGALDTVLAMRGVYFNYISDEAKNKRVGFIAQELELVLPEAVRYAEEIDEYNVEYAQIVSVLAEATKEQHKLILDQGAQIAELKLLVNQLINR